MNTAAPANESPEDTSQTASTAEEAIMASTIVATNTNTNTNTDTDTDTDTESEIAVRVKWASSIYPIELSSQSTMADLKQRLFELTEVLPKRQKVLGLPKVNGQLLDETHPLISLNLKPDQRILLIGSRETDIAAVNSTDQNIQSDVINDLDIDYDADDDHTGDSRVLRDIATYRRRLQRRIETTEIRIMNQPREGKKLLVLDLDYTLFDCRSSAPTVADLARPGLHHFLASMYRHYDIVIWSQTSWRWLEAKLTALSMIFATEYKICFVLDRTSMFSVTSRKNGTERTHEVKALEIIWSKFSNRWNHHNTVHIDDLSKNFAFNPQSGLKISAFKNAPITRLIDRELYYLDHYLSLIAQREPDFSKLKHKHWKRYCATHDPEWHTHANPSSQ